MAKITPDTWIKLFIVQASSETYVGRSCDSKTGEMSFITLPYIVSADRQVAGISDNTQRQEELAKILAKYNVLPEHSHQCTLKYWRKNQAEQLVERLQRRSQFRTASLKVVPIELIWGQPSTIRLA
jgi:hypothetical protein